MDDFIRGLASLLTTRKDNSRLTTNSRKRANAATMQLISTSSANDLEIERLIELAALVGGKSHSKNDLTAGCDHPSEAL
jgi:hypothetical protein